VSFEAKTLDPRFRGDDGHCVPGPAGMTDTVFGDARQSRTLHSGRGGSDGQVQQKVDHYSKSG